MGSNSKKLQIHSVVVINRNSNNNLRTIAYRHHLNSLQYHHLICLYLFPDNINSNKLNSHHSIRSSFRMLSNLKKVQRRLLIFNPYRNNLPVKINSKEVIFYNSLGNRLDSNFLDIHIKGSFNLLDHLRLISHFNHQSVAIKVVKIYNHYNNNKIRTFLHNRTFLLTHNHNNSQQIKTYFQALTAIQ